MFKIFCTHRIGEAFQSLTEAIAYVESLTADDLGNVIYAIKRAGASHFLVNRRYEVWVPAHPSGQPFADCEAMVVEFQGTQDGEFEIVLC